MLSSPQCLLIRDNHLLNCALFSQLALELGHPFDQEKICRPSLGQASGFRFPLPGPSLTPKEGLGVTGAELCSHGLDEV